MILVINRKIELYEMGWNLKDGLRDCLIAAAPYGGPIGKSRARQLIFVWFDLIWFLCWLIASWLFASCLIFISVAYTLNFQTFNQVVTSSLLSYEYA